MSPVVKQKGVFSWCLDVRKRDTDGNHVSRHWHLRAFIVGFWSILLTAMGGGSAGEVDASMGILMRPADSDGNQGRSGAAVHVAVCLNTDAAEGRLGRSC